MNLQLNLELNQAVKPKSQTEQIIDYLTSPVGTTIDTWTAYEQFKCTCLAQRIYDLQVQPEYKEFRIKYQICKETKTRNGKHFTEYWLENKNFVGR